MTHSDLKCFNDLIYNITEVADLICGVFFPLKHHAGVLFVADILLSGSYCVIICIQNGEMVS